MFHADNTAQTLDILPDKKIHVDNIAKVASKRRRDFRNRITKGHERRDSLKRQSDAPDQLKVVSQPSGVPVTNLKNFVYREEAGKGITIYVDDTGANKQSNVSILLESLVLIASNPR